MIEYMVCGMPRSRTAWLSVFLSDDSGLCLHEGINGCNSHSEYLNKFKNGITGDSTTAAKELSAAKVDCEKIIILRDPKECKQQCDALFGEISLDYYQDQFDYLTTLGGLVVDFNDINDNLRDIWEHVKDSKFNPLRAEKMKGLNVQVNLPYEVDIEAMENYIASVS